MSDRPQEPRIVYILGPGRSGTTILEILLAQAKDTVNVGEITHLFRDGYTHNDLCACGERTKDCEFWSELWSRCGFDDSSKGAYVTLFESVSSHRKFLKHVLIGFDELTFERYREVNQRIFDELAAMTGASIVIDSSKYAGRALALSRIYPKRLHVLYILKSPAGMVRSYRKRNIPQKHKSLLSLVAYTLFVMLSIRLFLWRTRSPVLKIGYSQLARSPEAQLSKIEAFCSMDTSIARQKVAQNRVLDKGHLVTANRIKFVDRLVFQPDNDEVLVGWGEKLTAFVIGVFGFVLRL